MSYRLYVYQFFDKVVEVLSSSFCLPFYGYTLRGVYGCVNVPVYRLLCRSVYMCICFLTKS